MKKSSLGLILLLFTGVVFGAEKGVDSLAYDMNEVVVTATRTPLLIKDVPVITRVVTAHDLERRGVATLQAALEGELAGVEFHQAGYGSTMSFQGLDARYVLFLVDGERMAGETYGNIDYSRIPMANIERIEIVRGAASGLYGSNAMGAVVNIITKMPKQEVEITASARYGSRFQSNGSEVLGTKATDKDTKTYHNRLDMPNLKGDLSVGLNLGKFKSLTTAAYRTVDAYKLVGTEDETRHYNALQIYKIRMGPGGMGMALDRTVQDTTIQVAPDGRGLSVSGWRDMNFSQRFDYAPSEKFRFEVSGNYFSKDRYDFNASVLDENPMPNSNKVWTFESYEGYNVKALMEHSPNANNKIYLSYVRDEYFRNSDSLSGISTPKQHHTYNMPRLLWTLSAGEHNRLTTGVEMINEQLRFDLNPAGYDDMKSLNTGSIYLQDEITTNLPLSFVLGLRGDYNDRFGGRLTPKASIKYDYRNLVFRANYSSGYRTPSLKEMYMEFTVPIPGQSSVIRGNDKLKSETNHYVSLSAEYTRPLFNISATFYNSYFRNKIDVRGHAEGTATILQYQNINHSKFGGIELVGRVRAAKGFFIKANYNYIYQTDDAPEGSTQYIYPSPHSATMQLDYGFMVKSNYVSLTAQAKYTGPKNYDDFMASVKSNPQGGIPLAIYMGTYSARHPGYMVCNLAVNWEFQRYFTLTMGVDNIFNYQSKVINFNSAITPPRNGFIRVVYSFASKR